MKISIIVPIYNSGKFLEQCLQSIQNQTLKDFEVICVNDGSTDNSLDIINEFVHNDTRFKLINKENTGYGNSMNIAIQSSKGDYVSIIESDDYVEPTMYEQLYSVVERFDVDVAKADFYENWDNGLVKKRENLKNIPIGKVFEPIKYSKMFGIHPSIWTSLYKKSFLSENNILFLETPGASYQDISFSFKVLISAKRVACIDDAVMHYRISNMDSSIHNPAKKWCVCDEIAEIVRYVEAMYVNKRLNEMQFVKAKEHIDWVKYANYVWNYQRIPFAYKYAFLIRMNQEFQYILDKSLENDVWKAEDKACFLEIKNNMEHFFECTAPKQLDDRLQHYNILNNGMEIMALNVLINAADNIIIYGAGVIGKEVYQYILQNGLKNKVFSFLVSELNQDSLEIDGIPIYSIKNIDVNKMRNSLILVSLAYKNHYQVVSLLEKYEVEKVLVVTDKMREYMKK